jgi:predicted amidophosphoribosyltransferase
VRSRVLDEIVGLFAPPRCLACGAPGGGLCPSCRARLPWLTGPRCPRCALPAPCAPCPAARASFTAAWSPVAHAGPARALVTALKFRRALEAADLMAAQVAAGLPVGLRGDGDGAAWVPVPSHPRRRRARGFDPADQLATALARRTGIPLRRCLRRGGAATPQLGASRAVRRRSGRVAIVARDRLPARAVLVDDVHTTGATLDAAARALLAAGAVEVVAVTYARTLLDA